MKYVSLLPLFVTLVASIDLKCDVENRIPSDSSTCTISNVFSTETDEFSSSLMGIFEEVTFKNSSLPKFPREIVAANNIMFLRMEDCNLRIIEPGTFVDVTSLAKLYLAGNLLEKLEPGMFDGLASVQVLYLSRNHIKEVQVDTFFGLGQLEYLNLAENKLTSLELAFNEPFGLKIDVRDNGDLTSVDYTCTVEALFCAVLIMDDNTVDLTCDVEHQYMEAVCMLEDIHTTKDSIPRVNHKYMEFGTGYYRTSELNTAYFKEIIFVNSDLYDLPPVLFDSYSYLEYLNMSNNKIQNLVENTFKNASVLLEVDLSRNLLTEVGPNIFNGAKELSLLDLSNNRLTTVDKHAFSMLTKLTSLSLASNLLKTIDLELRFNFPLVLNVSNCSTKLLRVTSYSESYIMPYSSSVVDACNNNLNELDLIKDGPIVSLMLENNTGELDLTNVTSMSSLTTLSLRNISSKIGNGMFKAMPQLENLDLAYTKLKLKYGLFATGSKLKKLDLSYNRGLNLDFHKLGALLNLEELLVDGNELRTLETFDLMMTFPRLKQISFLKNDFYCDLLVKTVVALEDRRIEVRYPSKSEQEMEEDNVNGIKCNSDRNNGRNYALEQQIDRQEKTFLTIYALKKAYL